MSSTDPADYRNTYEWSKAHAERLARELFPQLTIIRPPLIVGRRLDGRAARFAGMYTILRGMTRALDPHSRILAGEKLETSDVRLKGTVVGVGARNSPRTSWRRSDGPPSRSPGAGGR